MSLLGIGLIVLGVYIFGAVIRSTRRVRARAERRMYERHARAAKAFIGQLKHRH